MLSTICKSLESIHQFAHNRLLAEAPARSLPEALIARPKTGFAVPVEQRLQQINPKQKGRISSQAWARDVAHAYAGGSL